MNERDKNGSLARRPTSQSIVTPTSIVRYWPNTHPPLTTQKRELARWVGSNMCHWLLPKSGKPIADTTFQHVTAEDLRDSEIKKQVDDFDTELTQNSMILISQLMARMTSILKIFMIKTTKLTGTARTLHLMLNITLLKRSLT